MLRSFNENRVVIHQCNRYCVPCQRQKGFFGVILDIFWLIQPAFVIREQLCNLEISSWALKRYLGSFNENGVLGYQCNRSFWTLCGLILPKKIDKPVFCGRIAVRPWLFNFFVSVKNVTKLYSMKICNIFQKSLIPRLLCDRSQLANCTAVPLRCTIGACTGSKRLVIFLVRSEVRNRTRKLDAVEMLW